MALSECPPRAASRPPRLVTLETRDNDCTIVWVAGEHDASTVPELAENLALAIAFGNHDVLIDLHGVRFMDASTIGVMVRADQYLRPRSRALTIQSPSLCARRVLEVCGFTDQVNTGPLRAERSTNLVSL